MMGLSMWVTGMFGGLLVTAVSIDDGHNSGMLVLGSAFAGMAVMGMTAVWRMSYRQFARLEEENVTIREQHRVDVAELRQHHLDCEAGRMADRMRIAMLIAALQASGTPIPDAVIKNLVAAPEVSVPPIDGTLPHP